MKKIKIDEIVPAEYNPRLMDENELNNLKNSIQELGFIDPIIINTKNNRIIGGHQRYKILKQEGVEELFIFKLGEIGWVFSEDDLNVKSEDHEKAANLALNKIKGRWDNEKLDEILNDFSEKGFNVELTGFEDLNKRESKIDVSDLVDAESDDFFNTTFTDMDDIDELSSEEITLSASKTILKLGDFTLPLDTSTFNYWIRQIEKEHGFNLHKVKTEIIARLKL